MQIRFEFNIKKQLLRYDEVREILGCSKGHVYNLVRAGYLLAHHSDPASFNSSPGIRIIAQSVCDYLNKGIIPPEAWADEDGGEA